MKATDVISRSNLPLDGRRRVVALAVRPEVDHDSTENPFEYFL